MMLYFGAFDTGTVAAADTVTDTVAAAATGDAGHEVFMETGMDFGLLEKLNNGVDMVEVSFYEKDLHFNFL